VGAFVKKTADVKCSSREEWEITHRFIILICILFCCLDQDISVALMILINVIPFNTSAL